MTGSLCQYMPGDKDTIFPLQELLSSVMMLSIGAFASTVYSGAIKILKLILSEAPCIFNRHSENIHLLFVP